ncbi:arylsulfatase J-like isoform X2 [Paramacrobiotus metropolitanus]|uniref:arylsulfatase J-like isoform X2 n=1 Tax=Paramacrobiotus metropolitanus TaxID=2943436 RepID=UPI002445C1F9|nr:arylsulfatase J-like isoform X2 [Paramacrobiotus metropolitanus]
MDSRQLYLYTWTIVAACISISALPAASAARDCGDAAGSGQDLDCAEGGRPINTATNYTTIPSDRTSSSSSSTTWALTTLASTARHRFRRRASTGWRVRASSCTGCTRTAPAVLPVPPSSPANTLSPSGHPIKPGEPWGLPLQHKLLPEYMRQLGYSTHMIGKWHLGDHQTAYLPHKRGFDTFWGTPGGVLDYYSYQTFEGYNMYNGSDVLRFNESTYVTDLFAHWGQALIQERAAAQKPFFLYFAPNAPRGSVNRNDTLQTAPKYLNRPSVQAIAHPGRRKYAAMMQAVDDAVGTIHDAIRDAGLLHNTVVWFLSDNGGPLPQPGTFGVAAPASNWPLRGGKQTLFEGGVRVAGFVWGGPYNAVAGGSLYQHPMHLTDLLPTLVASTHVPELADEHHDNYILANSSTHGYNHWDYILTGRAGPRHITPLDINHTEGRMGLIAGRYKVVTGNYFNGSRESNKWTRPFGTSDADPQQVETRARVHCHHPEGREQTPCSPEKEVCLFDLLDDPCETNNLAAARPEVLEELLEHIRRWNASYHPVIRILNDPASDPALHGGVWRPWMD